MKKLFAVLFLTALAMTAVFADDKHHQANLSEGEVRKVDKDARKITLRHGPLPDLDMPKPMTMVYRVKDPAMLEKVKAGDKVKFQAEKINGVFTVTQIEPAP